ncbi:MAG: hypothetical protein ACOYN6_14435 [Ignavibacteria bacterium]
MKNSNMKSGICPECSCTDVFTDSALPKRGDRMIIPITGMRMLFTDCYVCLNCGYFEEYIVDKDLKDDKKISKIKETWGKVNLS